MIRNRAVKKGEFTLTSGKKSSYYIDIKKAYTDPAVLKEIVRGMKRIIGSEKFDRIAGLELGAVPLATALSLNTGIPFIIIRKEDRRHGTTSRIEGNLRKGEHVIVVEDVATTGGSLLSAVDAVREENCICEKAIVVVDRLEGAGKALKKKGVELIPLTTVKDLGIK